MYSRGRHIVPGNFIVHYCALGQNKARASKASSLTCTEKLHQSSLGPRLASFLVLCVFFSWSRRSLPLFSLHPSTVSMHFYVLPRGNSGQFCGIFLRLLCSFPRKPCSVCNCRVQPSETFLGIFALVSVRIALDHELVMLGDVGRLLRVIQWKLRMSRKVGCNVLSVGPFPVCRG